MASAAVASAARRALRVAEEAHLAAEADCPSEEVQEKTAFALQKVQEALRAAEEEPVTKRPRRIRQPVGEFAMLLGEELWEFVRDALKRSAGWDPNALATPR
uniref:Uncharacterized protein n=1 Tax=Zooxanthella nutricula TaxID=1333877 RepID=A0A7S2L7H8_9DINO